MDLVNLYHLWVLIAIGVVVALLILADWLITEWTTNVLREYVERRRGRRRASERH
jgi:hypothetical protein